MWAETFWIALGGAIGTIVRHWATVFAMQRFGGLWPVGTMAINISGSFAIGFVAAMSGPDGRWLVHPTVRQFFMIGLLGGYTTFSSFSLQTLDLARDGEYLAAGGNAVLSLIGCLLAVWAGHAAGGLLNRP